MLFALLLTTHFCIHFRLVKSLSDTNTLNRLSSDASYEKLRRRGQYLFQVANRGKNLTRHCSAHRLLGISGTYGGSTNNIISLKNALWIAEATGRSLVIPEHYYRILDAFDHQHFHGIFCTAPETHPQQVVSPRHGHGHSQSHNSSHNNRHHNHARNHNLTLDFVTADAVDYFNSLPIWNAGSLKKNLPPIYYDENLFLGSISEHSRKFFSYLWAHIKPEYVDAATNISQSFYNGSFDYISIHKRYFEHPANLPGSVMSKYCIDTIANERKEFLLTRNDLPLSWIRTDLNVYNNTTWTSPEHVRIVNEATKNATLANELRMSLENDTRASLYLCEMPPVMIREICDEKLGGSSKGLQSCNRLYISSDGQQPPSQLRDQWVKEGDAIDKSSASSVVKKSSPAVAVAAVAAVAVSLQDIQQQSDASIRERVFTKKKNIDSSILDMFMCIHSDLFFVSSMSTWSWHVFLVRSVLGLPNSPEFFMPPGNAEKLLYFDLRRDGVPSALDKINGSHLWSRYKEKFFLKKPAVN